jgi:glutaredoxin
MRALRLLSLLVLAAACFAAGLYGAPAARSAYARLFPEPPFRTGDYSQLHTEAGSAVVLFSTSTCPYCKKARALLLARGVAFKDYVIDTSADAQKRFDAVGGIAVPLLYIGDRQIRGFSESTISDALSALGTDKSGTPPT